MKTLRSIAEVRSSLAGHRQAGERIGLVPTMGAFHAGHLCLMARARAECDVVVVSLFVNPGQFNDADDLAAYPRQEGRDAALAEEAGVDYLFAPPAEEMYPAGFATTVSVSGLSETLEGAHRGRGHFDSVTTVVAKLLNIVAPSAAYFGQKDAQQVLVIKRMVRDLDLPVTVEVCPTVREPDGLALSSRNAHLDEADRPRAAALHRALAELGRTVEEGEHNAGAARAVALAELESAGIEPDYLELVGPQDLAPVAKIENAVLAVVAARVGQTRLIDNELIDPGRTAQNDNGRP